MWRLDMRWAVLFLLLILAAIFGPFITIWALNTLFPVLAVPYTIETYFAVIAMGIFFNTNISTKKD
jgi:hypothetical protein